VINIFFIFRRYLEKMLVPVNLNVLYYVHPISSLFSLQGLISLLVTLIFLVIAYITLKKNRTGFPPGGDFIGKSGRSFGETSA
jgi:hypothetical protein